MDIAELIEIGYEIADSNAEGETDFDEACRIYQERHPEVTVTAEMIAYAEPEFAVNFGLRR
jgi:hypothetical protein